MSNENSNAPDEAAQWYSELRTNNIRQVDARLEELANGHAALENAYNALDAKAEAAHDALDTRQLIEIERERSRLLQEAQQVQQGYSTLQAERQRMEQHTDPRFDELLANSSGPAQMFLRTHRASLENNPDRLRQLLFAEARARASGLKVDGKHYYAALEAACDLSADDRNLNDFSELSDEMRASRNATKRQTEPELTPQQAEFSRSIPGVTPEEYAAAVKNPFSQAASSTQYVEPAEFDSGKHEPMEIKFEETPRKTVDMAKYKPSAQSVNLSRAERELCENMAVQLSKPVNEVLKDFARNKIALHSGKAGHYQLYADKLASEGHH